MIRNMVAMFLKSLLRKRKGMNVFLKSFVKGDYYQNLIVETDRVRSAGLTFPNDFYFLAERKIFNYASVFYHAYRVCRGRRAQ
ncbi:hypothetical protein E5E93_03300 [Escherichia coli]|nr:hypothetical protein E5E93_03300 [Escherichia coli]